MKMADVRTLKLNLLADVSDFSRGIAGADDQTNKFERNLRTNGRKMAKSIGLVIAAVGTMATAFGIDAVKAYAEDEASQAKFRTTLKNTAGVVDETIIKSINNFIERMQFASGYSDGELRDALGRLTRSTGDVSDAQKILEVAMDTSRGTGKDLTTVTDILAKAVDGNYTPLKKMGVKLDDNTISTKDFNGVLDTLTTLFGGQATTYADTFQGKLDIVNQRFGELKESAGAKLLDPLGKLLEVVNDVAKGFAGETEESGLTGKVGMMQRELTTKKTGGYTLGEALKVLADSFGNLFSALNDDKDADSTLNTLADALQNVASGINAIAEAYRKGKTALEFIARADKAFQDFLGVPDAVRGTMTRPGKAGAAGASVMANQAIRVGEFGPEVFIPSGSGSIRPAGGGGGVTIIMNGVIDGESARRSIERLLQDSSRRTGAINLVGATL
jgi:hypothetical protein